MVSICRSTISSRRTPQLLLTTNYSHSFSSLFFAMKYSGIAASATALMAGVASAAVTGVAGKPEGFASSTTGGGNTAAVYPSTTDELVSYLGDDSARVIVLTKTFDFTGTEGTTTSSGCAPCKLIQQQSCTITVIVRMLILLICRGHRRWMPNCH